VRWIIRRSALLLSALAAAALVAGCATGGGTPSAAAVVGDAVIPLDTVQNQIRSVLRNEPEGVEGQPDPQAPAVKEQTARGIVRNHIQHELLATAVEREGLSAEAADVETLIERAGGVDELGARLGASPEEARTFARDVVLLDELAVKYLDRLSITVVGGAVVDEDENETRQDKANALGEAIARDPDRAAELAAEQGHQPIEEEVALADVAGAFSAGTAIGAAFGVEAGTVVVMPVDPQEEATWLTLLVAERTVADEPEDAEDVAHEPSGFFEIGRVRLGPVADEVGVEVNPRFGVWDRAAMDIAPRVEEIQGQLLVAGDDRS
jgi:hypothetical protein